MADETLMPEPGEGTAEDMVVDRADCVEELIEALADTVVFKARAHGAHWNVKGPGFGAYHELFGEIYEDAAEAVDPLAEQLLKLDVDAPSTLDEFSQRSTITPQQISSDDPQVLATDLRDMNDMVLESLEDTFDCANDLDEQGLCNFIAERIDMHKKWRWQLTRSISNAAEAPVVAPMNPPEDTEVEEEDDAMLERSVVGEAELRSRPDLVGELRSGADVVEQRHASTKVEFRDQGDGTWTLTGLAAVFDSMSEPLGGFTEVIKRGAFKNVLKDTSLDTRALFNHDPNMPLARTTNGTLSLRETPRGLEYTAIIPAGLSYGNDLRVLLENGTITQSSFAFKMPAGGKGQDWADGPDGTLVRTITDFGALLDVSPVTYPAYRAATAGVRNETSDDSSERSDQADATEQVTNPAEESRLREEQERARRERELRLRERKLATLNNK
jgi:HK97 family phage prohead protease